MTNNAIRILIADDDFAVRISMVELLEDFGHHSIGVETTSEALAALEDEPFDVAIIDMRIPEIGGERLIREAAAKFPGLRFMVYTGSTDFTLPPSLVELGMTKDDLLFKPIRDIDEFVQRIVDKVKNP